MNFSSKLLENAVYEISQLPSIGKKSALRLALHLLKQPEGQTDDLVQALTKLRHQVVYCSLCHNISDDEICEICANPKRDATTICVVEDLRDVMAIENTGQYQGHYHILGGKISPLDGIGPSDLNIHSLLQKLQSGEIRELIFALSNTMEGDTTSFYIFRQMGESQVVISTLARGIAVGNELEYTDEITLGRSIVQRVPFEKK